MIALHNLTVRTTGGHVAVRGADLAIQPGQRLGVVGESGSGKTLLALSMIGMVPEGLQVDGQVLVKGETIAADDERAWRRHRARTMAMIFQEPMAALNPLVRVGDTVAEPLRLHLGLDRAAARKRALDLFEETGIPQARRRLGQYPHELSGGQRQRVLIALALACDPDLLIADEPTTALDAQVALRITDLLVRLSQDRQMALMFISHDLAAVSRTTHDIVVMYGGDIVERGQTVRVLSDPAHPYTQGLLAARPSLMHRERRLPTIPGTVPQLFALPPGCRFAGRCARELPQCVGTRPPVVATPTGQAACHLPGAGQT
ncbi:ABC transporter ATP-binding protein [Sedimentitalea nanhaiensis]|uniref:Peptide/nickel transport system ATP-binding protein n=1 Tax=Sedimentitalea nanhaiensis TaxID=999627 RepID=A0A1I6YY58_9RHOB|nr:ABC transporter ATP-binding protein [Sedimentitalea nanhaiensis]SFT55423.1 peptide/nickel transport system ATP-binding protein [Sedimentitalea nanhaiensis]